MEAARIDWNNIDSVFVEDRLYEHFNAPKWVDLLSPDSTALSVDDVSWFCTPDCNHPVTADDFLTSTPSPFSSKTRGRRSSSSHRQVPPLGDRNHRDSTFERKGTVGSLSGFYEDVENKSPRVHAPFSPNGRSKTVADPIAEKRKLANDDSLMADAIPRLKSTLSASNLFAGRDLLKQISEFCTELKKLATRTKEKEFAGTRNKANGIPPFAKAKSSDIISSLEAGVEGKERSTLLEVTEQASDVLKRSKAVKEKKRTNRVEDAENVPISIELDKNGHKGHLSQIRTSPPTPQCFSATRGPPPPESTPSPASKTRLKERQILGEVKQTRRDATTEENLHKVGGTGVVHGKAPDVFWFLKPCTLSSSS